MVVEACDGINLSASAPFGEPSPALGIGESKLLSGDAERRTQKASQLQRIVLNRTLWRVADERSSIDEKTDANRNLELSVRKGFMIDVAR